MESITVYQKIPHPGIGVNLNGYYAKQVGTVSRESSGRAGQGRAGSWWWRQVGERESACSTLPSSVTEVVTLWQLHLCICDVGRDHGVRFL